MCKQEIRISQLTAGSLQLSACMVIFTTFITRVYAICQRTKSFQLSYYSK